jgi:hypothetical protein
VAKRTLVFDMELLIANLYLNGKDIKDINAQLFDLDALI